MVIQYLIGLKAQSSELEELKRIFLELDVDQDGQISEDEMLQGMESVTKDLQELVGGKPDWGQMFKQLDVNGDGRVNFDEFIAACYDRRSLLNDDNLKLAFDLLDVDNDGKIQKRDLAACLASTSTMNNIDVGEEIWTSLAGDADANQDDEITFREFKRYMKEHTAKDQGAKE